MNYNCNGQDCTEMLNCSLCTALYPATSFCMWDPWEAHGIMGRLKKVKHAWHLPFSLPSVKSFHRPLFLMPKTQEMPGYDAGLYIFRINHELPIHENTINFSPSKLNQSHLIKHIYLKIWPQTFSEKIVQGKCSSRKDCSRTQTVSGW